MTPRALSLVVACNGIAGASFLAMAWTLRGFTAEGSMFWRLLLGALVYAPLVRRDWPAAGLSREDWGRAAIVGLLGLALPLMLGVWGLQRSTAVNASLLTGLEPVGMILLGRLLLGERLSARGALAVLLGLAGSALIVLQGSLRLTPHWRGDALLILQAFCWSIYSVVARAALARVPAAVFGGLSTAFAVLPLAFFGDLRPQGPVPAEAWAGLAFQVVGVTFASTLLWNKALEEISATTMAQFVFLQLPIGAALGVLVLGEPLTRWTVAGASVIVCAVLLAGGLAAGEHEASDGRRRADG